MDYDALRAGMAAAVPFNNHLGLEVIELGPGSAVVRLPDDERLRNHVGSQHAVGPVRRRRGGVRRRVRGRLRGADG